MIINEAIHKKCKNNPKFEIFPPSQLKLFYNKICKLIQTKYLKYGINAENKIYGTFLKYRKNYVRRNENYLPN